MVRFSVQFDKPSRYYLPGEEVKCFWRIRLNEPIEFNLLYVEYYGRAKTKWTKHKILSKKSIFCNFEKTCYTGKQDLFSSCYPLMGKKNGPIITLPAKEYNYETKYQLSAHLPQTFEETTDFLDKFGNIFYGVSISFINNDNRNNEESYHASFYLGPTLNLNDHQYLQTQTDYSERKKFGLCCWKSDPIKLIIKMPKKGYTANDTIKFKVEVENDSDVAILNMKVKLREKITYFSQSPYNKTYESMRILWCKNLSSESTFVQKSEDKIFDIEIELNPTMEFKVLQNCAIVLVDYFIDVTVFPKGIFHKKLTCIARITIGTVPFDNQSVTSIGPYLTLNPASPTAPVIENATAPLLEITDTDDALPSYFEAVFGAKK